MRCILCLFISFTVSFCNSQNCIYDSIIKKADFDPSLPEHFKNKEAKDTSLCYRFMKEACELVSHDSICIPYLWYGHNRTYNEILERDYHILNHNPIHGDVRFDGVSCWDEVMKEAIEQKYGSGFFRKIYAYADTLDKTGMGFIKPIFTKGDSKKWFKQALEEYHVPEKRVLLLLEIDTNGKIEKARMYHINVYIDFEKRENLLLKYKDLKQYILQEYCWEAARFRGKPVQDKLIVTLF